MSHPRIQFLLEYKEDLTRLANMEFDVLDEDDTLLKESIEMIKNMLSKQWSEFTEEDHERVDELAISEEDWPSDLEKLQEILEYIYADIPLIEKIVLPLWLVICYIEQRITLDGDVEVQSAIKHYDCDQIFDYLIEYSDPFCSYYLLTRIQCPSRDIRLALKQAWTDKDKEGFCRIIETNRCDYRDLDVFMSSVTSVQLSANNILLNSLVNRPLANNAHKISFITEMNDAAEHFFDTMNLVVPTYPVLKNGIDDFYDSFNNDAIEWYPNFDKEEYVSKLDTLIHNHVIDYGQLQYLKYFTGINLWDSIKKYKEEGKLMPFEISIIDEIINRPGGKELVDEWDEYVEEDEDDEDENSDENEQDGLEGEAKVPVKRGETPDQILYKFFKEWPLETLNSMKIEKDLNEFSLDQRLWLNKQIPKGTYKRTDTKFKEDFFKSPDPLTEAFIKNFREIYIFLTLEPTRKGHKPSIGNSIENCKLLFYRFSGIDCRSDSSQSVYINWLGTDPEYIRFVKYLLNDGKKFKSCQKFYRLQSYDGPEYDRVPPDGSLSGRCSRKTTYQYNIDDLLSVLDIKKERLD